MICNKTSYVIITSGEILRKILLTYVFVLLFIPVFSFAIDLEQFRFSLKYEGSLFTPVNGEAEVLNRFSGLLYGFRYAESAFAYHRYNYQITDVKCSHIFYTSDVYGVDVMMETGVFYRYCNQEGLRGYDCKFSLPGGDYDGPYYEKEPLVEQSKHALGVSFRFSYSFFQNVRFKSGLSLGSYFRGKSYILSEDDLNPLYTQDRFIYTDYDLLAIEVDFPFDFMKCVKPYYRPADEMEESSLRLEYGFCIGDLRGLYAGLTYDYPIKEHFEIRTGVLMKPLVKTYEKEIDDYDSYEEKTMINLLEIPAFIVYSPVKQFSLFGGLKINHIVNSERTVEMDFWEPRIQQTVSDDDIEIDDIGFAVGFSVEKNRMIFGLRADILVNRVIFPEIRLDGVEDYSIPKENKNGCGINLFVRHNLF